MGSAGHAFIAHTKGLSPPAHVKDGGYGLPPHPVLIRPGQRFHPRYGKRRRPFQIRSVSGEQVIGVREDSPPIRLKAERLLATADDAQGRFYLFQGFASRRYKTHAYVWALEEDEAVLSVPEWHPRRPLWLPARLVPEESRLAGAWLALRCDLGASYAARLQPSDLRPSEDPGAERMHRPSLEFGVRGPTPVERRRTAGAESVAASGEPSTDHAC